VRRRKQRDAGVTALCVATAACVRWLRSIIAARNVSYFRRWLPYHRKRYLSVKLGGIMHASDVYGELATQHQAAAMTSTSPARWRRHRRG
jgi:hypothetical protein